MLHQKILEINKKEKVNQSIELSKFINQFLNKIEKNLTNFHYNVIIANIHEAYSQWIKIIKKEENYSNLTEEYSKFLISVSPILPHLSNECLSGLKINHFEWPSVDQKFLIEENVSIVVQFNGKKRGSLEIKKDIPEDELIKTILNTKSFDKFTKDNTIKKHFYVKNRLINFLI